MPIYEYRCQGCGRRSSALLPSWSSADPACSHCGSAAVARQVSTFATVRSESDDFGGGDDFGAGGDEFSDGGEDEFGGGRGDFGDDDF